MSFNLGQSLKNWKKQLLAKGNMSEGDVEEMSDHLLSLYDELLESNTPEQAFNKATRQMGHPLSISGEYKSSNFSGHMSWYNLILPDLITHYLKTSVRILFRNRVNAAINILCLGLGIACFVFIGHFLAFHLSVDKQFADSNIYRLIYETRVGDYGGIYPHNPVPMGPTIKTQFPEIKDAVRIWKSKPVLKVGEHLFYEDHMVLSDPTFFNFFQLPLRQGDPAKVLLEPGSVVLSSSMAKRYFGDENPIGEVIKCDGYPTGQVDLKVTGIFEDLPQNTHLKFNIVATLEGVEQEKTNWGSFKPIYVYLKLHDANNTGFIGERMSALADEHFKYRKENSDVFQYFLEPVSDIHIKSEVESAMKPAIDATLLWTMGVIGLMIIGLSCMNYINLALSQLYNQYREVGVRKVYGSSLGQLQLRFFIGGLVTLLFAIVLAGGIIVLTKDFYQEISGISITLKSFLSYQFIWVIGGFGILICFLTIYLPGFRLAGLQTLTVLKGKVNSGRSLWNQGFVMAQFVISSVLLISAFLMQDQISYIFNRELGVDGESVVVVKRPPIDAAFENSLNRYAGIKSWSFSQLLPMNEMSYDGRPINLPGDPKEYSTVSTYAGPGYLETYGMELIAGRKFSGEKMDSASFIINESAVNDFGLGTPLEALGRELLWSQSLRGKVVGVVKDFHLRSLHEEIGPVTMLQAGKSRWYTAFLSVKSSPESLNETIDFLREQYGAFEKDLPFEFFMINESFRMIHEEDLKFSNLAKVFSSVAIFIAMMGLFGLVNIELNKRMKEVGIRKVLGSSVRQIFVLLGQSYILRVVGSFVIAAPIAIIVINEWLDQYAYQMDFSLLTIALSGFLILMVAGATVAWKLLKVSLVNPVKLLKEE